MPLTINTGLSRKHGLPDYGSVGASCHVEFEVGPTLIDQDLDAFQAKVQGAFIACSQAVNDELARQGQDQLGTHAAEPTYRDNGHPQAPATNGNGNGAAETSNRPTSSNSGRSITAKQLAYVRQLAARTTQLGELGIDGISVRCFGKPAEDLTSFQGSQLIDQLKAIKSGEVTLPEALSGATS